MSKIPVILPKVQVAGYSWTRIHPIYVVLHEVVWHAAWYMERAKMAAISSGISHVTTKQHCKYTTLVDIQTCYKKLVTHLESHATWVQQTYLRAGNRAKLKKKKINNSNAALALVLHTDDYTMDELTWNKKHSCIMSVVGKKVWASWQQI